MSFETANGVNRNVLLHAVDAGKPMMKDKSKLIEMPVNQGFVIDFITKKGGVYIIL